MACKPSAVIPQRTRGCLPHWERNDGTYFVTFRLGDSLQCVMPNHVDVLFRLFDGESLASICEKQIGPAAQESRATFQPSAFWFVRG